MSNVLKMKKEGNFEWGITFSADIKNHRKTDIRQDFLETTMKAFIVEVNKYSVAAKDTLWWFNERALVGLFASGLSRQCPSSVALQEYSCFKNENTEKRGRVDLWISFNKKKMLFEAKRINWDIRKVKCCFGNEEGALAKAKDEYAKVENKNFRLDYIGSICFTRLRSKNMKAVKDNIKKWEEPCDIRKNGYYCFVRLKEDFFNSKCEYPFDSYYYPALCITGILQEYKR
jgi:hypothetical protein